MLLRSVRVGGGGPSMLSSSFRRMIFTIVKPTDNVLLHLTFRDPNTAAEIFTTLDRQPVGVKLGRNMAMLGLEQYLPGKKVGDTFKQVFPPELAFGYQLEDGEKIRRLPLDQIPDEPKIGMLVELEQGRSGIVIEMDEKFASLDCNNALAGVEMEFEITIVRVLDDDDTDDSAFSIQMSTLKKGDEKTFPSEGNKVYVHCVGMLASNGKVFESTRKRGEPFSFVLGSGQVFKGVNAGVSTMSLGQRAQIRLPSDMAYGSEGDGNLVPPNAEVIFDVQLMQIDDDHKTENERLLLSPAASPSASFHHAALSTIVKPGDYIMAHLTCKDPNTDNVFISTAGSDPTMLWLGKGTMIPGLAMYLPGKMVGDTFKQVFPPELAFGCRVEDDQHVFTVPINQLLDKPMIGLRVELEDGRFGIVTEVDEEFVYVDRNHVLAGQEVEVEVTIVSVVDAALVRVHVTNLTAGDGKTFPSEGSKVYVHCVGTLASNGEEFESSYKRGEPLSFVLGAGQVVVGLDAAVAKMSLGQRAQIRLQSEVAYGSTGDGNLVPPDAVVAFDVQLMQIDDHKV